MIRLRALTKPLDRLLRGLLQVHRWRGFYYWMVNARALVLSEFWASPGLPWRTRLRLWRHGFVSRSYGLYRFDQNDWNDYLSDAANMFRCYRLNGNLYQVLNDKLAFYQAMAAFPEVVPKTYLLSDAYGLRFLDPQAEAACGGDVIELLKREGKLALKPVDGGSGRGFAILEARDDRLFVNAEEVTADRLLRRLRSPSGDVLGEFVGLHPTLAQIFPETANTVKVLTMWDYDVPEPFIAAAIHRIGSRASYPLDTWAKGGICAPVDIASGRLGQGLDKRLQPFDVHPDTGATINGAVVPNWPAVAARLLEICRRMANFHYVAWDVIVTEDGFRLLEGNNRTSIDLLQIHTPLLRNDRVRRFYRRHGVIGR